MAKWTKTTVGSVLKAKEAGQPDYIKIKNDITLRAGQSLRLESKASKLKDLEQGIELGRINPELAEKIRTNIDKHPDFVRFDIVLLSKNE